MDYGPDSASHSGRMARKLVRAINFSAQSQASTHSSTQIASIFKKIKEATYFGGKEKYDQLPMPYLPDRQLSLSSPMVLEEAVTGIQLWVPTKVPVFRRRRKSP